MTKIKLCGLSRWADIAAANALQPEYIGFVFAPNSKRVVTVEQATRLKQNLNRGIQTVGVFVDAEPEQVAELLNSNLLDLVQLHGKEDADYIHRLRTLTSKPILKAYQLQTEADALQAQESAADICVLDSGAGTGNTFDWTLLKIVTRPYFLAGGLTVDKVTAAVNRFHPYAVDVSSGIETDGRKDPKKMAAFVAAVRKEHSI